MNAAATGAVIERLCAQTIADVLATGLGRPDDVTTTLTAQMRYRGQGSEVAVPVAPGLLAAQDAILHLTTEFQAEYRALYRRILSGPIEIIAWSARSTLPITPAPKLALPPPVRADPTTAALVDLRSFVAAPAPVLLRAALVPDTPLPGPAVIIDTGTTVIIPPGWSATSTTSGHLMLRRAP
jgi:N-methylhydantoinase A/oxoprolinase/acetone carboxylase beta subunit